MVDGEVGRAVNRPGGRAVPGLGSLLVSGFLEEGKAVRCGSQSRGLGGGTLLSCSPLLQGIRVKGDEDDAFQTSVNNYRSNIMLNFTLRGHASVCLSDFAMVIVQICYQNFEGGKKSKLPVRHRSFRCNSEYFTQKIQKKEYHTV